MKREDFDAAFKRWNNVPLSDLRGQYNVMLYTLRDGFEKRLPPWKRWMVKSNGRRYVPARRVLVRPIRGIHIRTKDEK